MDLGHVFLVKQRITNAADSAALAIGGDLILRPIKQLPCSSRSSAPDTPQPEERRRLGHRTQVNVTITVTVPMTFMQVLNTQSVDITVGAAAVRPQGKLELPWCLTKRAPWAPCPRAPHVEIASLKLAAKDLIDAVVWDNQTADYYSKVAIVPYAAGVNVGGSIPTPCAAHFTGLPIARMR
jgi:hypothetical protein